MKDEPRYKMPLDCRDRMARVGDRVSSTRSFNTHLTVKGEVQRVARGNLIQVRTEKGAEIWSAAFLWEITP